jgi:hypothetical protein
MHQIPRYYNQESFEGEEVDFLRGIFAVILSYGKGSIFRQKKGLWLICFTWEQKARAADSAFSM